MTLLDVFHPQLDELGSTSPDSRGDRVPLGPTPPAWWLSGVPAGATPVHTGGTGTGACLIEQGTGLELG